jgi:hypothetical protein
MLKPLIRDRCIMDGSTRLSRLHTFRQFPVWMGCTDAPVEEDLRHDMQWGICEDCGTIQLLELIPLDVLYAQSHNSGVVGGLWDKHHRAFADFVLEHRPNAVLEIGGGHGMLSMHCHSVRPEIDWTILEPNPTPRPECKARYIEGFFDGNLRFDRKIDMVVHSHVFEHLYDPMRFLSDLEVFLPPGGRHLFSMPNIPTMVDRFYTNALNFEHTYFVDEEVLNVALENHGLRITDKRNFQEDHSIFIATERVKAASHRLPNAKAKVEERFRKFLAHYQALVKTLNAEIAEHDGPIYLFGGHVFSQYLIAFGLDTERIRMVLDNDPIKQGKRLAGTRLGVGSPTVLSGETNALVILQAGVYNEEIRQDIICNINKSVLFI